VCEEPERWFEAMDKASALLETTSRNQSGVSKTT
jgi:hypothetical protein